MIKLRDETLNKNVFFVYNLVKTYNKIYYLLHKFKLKDINCTYEVDDENIYRIMKNHLNARIIGDHYASDEYDSDGSIYEYEPDKLVIDNNIIDNNAIYNKIIDKKIIHYQKNN